MGQRAAYCGDIADPNGSHVVDRFLQERRYFGDDRRPLDLGVRGQSADAQAYVVLDAG